MNIAIKVQEINDQRVQTVDARELHAFLEVGKVFGTWITDRIKQYGFVEGSDYVTLAPQNGGAKSNGGDAFASQNREAKRGGQNRIDYHISLDMAKELSMVERNAKGKEARQYFIDCERRAKEAAAQPKLLDLNDPAFLRTLLGSYAERVEIAEAKVDELSPKAQAYDRLDSCEGAVGLRVAAKTLGYPERKLAKWLEVNGWAFRQNGRGPLQAYAQRRKDGYLDHKLGQYVDPATGEEKASVSMTITPKGLARLAKLIPDLVGGVSA